MEEKIKFCNNSLAVYALNTESEFLPPSMLLYINSDSWRSQKVRGKNIK